MKTMKNRIIIKSLLLTLIFLILPMAVTAMGNSEKEYGEVLEEEFTSIAEALEAGEIDRQTAIDQLHELRTDFGREENEDYQTMERLLTAVQSRDMTALQAREQLRLLDECQLDNSEIKLQAQIRNTNQIKTQENAETPVKSGEASSGDNKPGQQSGGSSDKNNGKK